MGRGTDRVLSRAEIELMCDRPDMFWGTVDRDDAFDMLVQSHELLRAENEELQRRLEEKGAADG